MRSCAKMHSVKVKLRLKWSTQIKWAGLKQCEPILKTINQLQNFICRPRNWLADSLRKVNGLLNCSVIKIRAYYLKIFHFAIVCSYSSTTLTLFALFRCSRCLCGSTITWTKPGPLVILSAWCASIWSTSTCTPPSTSWCASACVAVSSSCGRWGTTHPSEKQTRLSVPWAGC